MDADILLIGGGDVVANRMAPALVSAGVPAERIEILSPAFSDEARTALLRLGARLTHLSGGPDEVVDRARETGAPVVVAAPSARHMDYIDPLAALGRPYAVEKPLVVAKKDVAALAASPGRLNRAFALSYYTLEKALALTWFAGGHAEHGRLVDAEINGRPAAPEDVALFRQRMGRPLRIHAQLLEGAVPDGRLWSLSREAGGVVFDILIHVALTAGKLAPGPLEIDDVRGFVSASAASRLERAGLVPSATLVDVGGSAAGVPLRLRAGKLVAAPGETRTRFLAAEFEGGRLHCCFETGALAAAAGEDRLQAAPPLLPIRYRCQAELLRAYFARGWRGRRFDERDDQLRLLPALGRIEAAAAKGPVRPDETLEAWHRAEPLDPEERPARTGALAAAAR